MSVCTNCGLEKTDAQRFTRARVLSKDALSLCQEIRLLIQGASNIEQFTIDRAFKLVANLSSDEKDKLYTRHNIDCYEVKELLNGLRSLYNDDYSVNIMEEKLGAITNQLSRILALLNE